VRWFFDTSVLLPALVDDHVHHEPALAALVAANRRTGCCAAHSLAELYATVTRLPAPYRTSSDQALLFLESIVGRLAIVFLDGEEYLRIIRRAAKDGVVGATIYDALLAGCALKSGAETIYTWNERHFRMLGPEIAERVRTP
jgi:predicted nucleic acid-binding protein